MSDVVSHKRNLGRDGRLRWFDGDPKKVLFTPGRGGSVQFTDGRVRLATCLGCHDAPCIEYREQELSIDGALQSFPGDPSRDVCPTDAIGWNDAGDAAVVDSDHCIGCGLCAARCPYGAISMDSNGVAVVEGADPDGICHTTHTSVGPHLMISRTGTLGGHSLPFIRQAPEIIGTLSDRQLTLIARNMLISAGVTASMGRRGDTNVRMDGVLCTRTGQLGAIELESGTAVLESPRALLDDIAVLSGRFQIPVAAIVPVSLLLTLPNLRSEYYRVIDDIQTVLGVQCRTITLGALAVLIWHLARIDSLDGDLFTTTRASTVDLHTSLIDIIPALPPAEPYPGAYRPPK